jgi:hypothetical protein
MYRMEVVQITSTSLRQLLPSPWMLEVNLAFAVDVNSRSR